MVEQARTGFQIDSLNSTLDAFISERNIQESFFGTEDAVKLLSQLGLTSYSRVIIRSASILNDIAYSRDPNISLKDATIVPTISAIIHAALGMANGEGHDVKTEISVAGSYLESVVNHDDASPSKEPLTTENLNQTLNPAIRALGEARKIIA